MRVLLVEDEADVRHFFARALAHIGPCIEVLQAADGHEALALFLGGPVDLVLSDQRMPRMTGLELLAAVRARAPVPFLLISADRSVEGAAIAAGASEFLTKPIGFDALRAAVLRYLPACDPEYTG
jgi:CheY-like chemotaxis protein